MVIVTYSLRYFFRSLRHFYSLPHLSCMILLFYAKPGKALRGFHVVLLSTRKKQTSAVVYWMDHCFPTSVVSLALHFYDSYAHSNTGEEDKSPPVWHHGLIWIPTAELLPFALLTFRYIIIVGQMTFMTSRVYAFHYFIRIYFVRQRKKRTESGRQRLRLILCNATDMSMRDSVIL